MQPAGNCNHKFHLGDWKGPFCGPVVHIPLRLLRGSLLKVETVEVRLVVRPLHLHDLMLHAAPSAFASSLRIASGLNSASSCLAIRASSTASSAGGSRTPTPAGAATADLPKPSLEQGKSSHSRGQTSHFEARSDANGQNRPSTLRKRIASASKAASRTSQTALRNKRTSSLPTRLALSSGPDGACRHHRIPIMAQSLSTIRFQQSAHPF